MNLKENKITITLLDIVNMYPLTRLSLIKQAIHHCAKNLSVKDKSTLESCLSMIAFGMQTSLMRFKDQYFNYKGAKGKDNNMCATYIFEMRERCFRRTKYKGIYHDDSLVKKIDTLVGGTFFQFTAEIWTPDKDIEEINNDLVKQQWLDKVKVINDHTFPFLGMQMEWKGAILTFSVYAKPNHTIKYAGNNSCYHPSVFKAILTGVFTRLGRLTSITMENINQPITELYPAHMPALQSAGILPNKIPSMKELQEEEILCKQQALADKISKTIQKFQKKHSLSFLR
eukprot:5827841-Ditylum_brightwellii.AAC.1